MHVVEWQSSSWLVYQVWEENKYFFQTSLLKERTYQKEEESLAQWLLYNIFPPTGKI